MQAMMLFFENAEATQVIVPYDFIKIARCTLELGCGNVNLQSPLRKPGNKSGLLVSHLD